MEGRGPVAPANKVSPSLHVTVAGSDKTATARQDRNQRWRLAHLLTQRVRLGVGVLHLGC